MKYKLATLLTLILMMAYVSSGQGQTSKGGIKGGLNLSNLYIDDVEDENVRLGFHAGVYTQINLLEFLAIQPELVYSTKGAKADYRLAGLEGENKFNLTYLDLPVLATLKLGDGADIHLGPYLAYLVSVSHSHENNLGSSLTELERDDYEKWDYGLSGGLELNFEGLSFGLRYNYGLRKIAKTDNAEAFIGDAKNSVAQAYIALNLRQ